MVAELRSTFIAYLLVLKGLNPFGKVPCVLPPGDLAETKLSGLHRLRAVALQPVNGHEIVLQSNFVIASNACCRYVSEDKIVQYLCVHDRVRSIERSKALHIRFVLDSLLTTIAEASVLQALVKNLEL